MAKFCCWRGAEDVPLVRIHEAVRKSPGLFRYKKTNNPVCVVVGTLDKEEAARAVWSDSTYYRHNHPFDFEEVKDEIMKELHSWIEPPPLLVGYPDSIS